jgi:hypothetical protein
MTPFSTFQKFSNLDQAQELVDLLVDNQIAYQVEDTSPDVVLASSDSVIKEIRIRIKQEDFVRVNNLLEAIAQSSIAEASKDHYLFEFSDEELYEVLEKPDEWGKNDYALAQKILQDRGKEITKEKLQGLQEARMVQLSKPEGGHLGWIVFGYVCAIGGGGLGIMTGWHLMTFKKTLPDGRKIYVYSPSLRKQGQWILFIGVPSFIIWLFLALQDRIGFYKH